ncbi:hypothetical protein [Thermocoleostomius sinensis]|uniref:Uncharacterized protein n=1 Tax=Thermocoleostomius sinensis A174 TaxID=2016057 RepID=A0A9E8ZIK2_9CYAN|nr:hypothetical protein [Thermocoleostomius sinensis]WAL59186.1 hypothetical protein OXH18_18695 [Thermocoleostomius sinensis A174]
MVGQLTMQLEADPGVQYAAKECTRLLKQQGIAISMAERVCRVIDADD